MASLRQALLTTSKRSSLAASSPPPSKGTFKCIVKALCTLSTTTSAHQLFHIEHKDKLILHSLPQSSFSKSEIPQSLHWKYSDSATRAMFIYVTKYIYIILIKSLGSGENQQIWTQMRKYPNFYQYICVRFSLGSIYRYDIKGCCQIAKNQVLQKWTDHKSCNRYQV